MKLFIVADMPCCNPESERDVFDMISKNGIHLSNKLPSQLVVSPVVSPDVSPVVSPDVSPDVSSVVYPDVIFTPPYICSLQTGYPISSKFKIPINIENALFPFNSSIYNIDSPYKSYLQKYFPHIFNNIDFGYSPTITCNNIRIPETQEDFNNRIISFLYKLKKGPYNSSLIISSCEISKKILNHFKISVPEKWDNGSFISFDI